VRKMTYHMDLGTRQSFKVRILTAIVGLVLHPTGRSDGVWRWAMSNEQVGGDDVAG
jgi:hypothetical protein